MAPPTLSLDQRSTKSVDEPKKKRKKPTGAASTGTSKGTGWSTSEGVAPGSPSKKTGGSSSRTRSGNAPTYSPLAIHDASTSSLHLPNSNVYTSVTASTDSLARSPHDEGMLQSRLLKAEDMGSRRSSTTDAITSDAKGKGRATQNALLSPGVTYTTTTSSSIVPIKKRAVNIDIADAVKNAGLAPPGGLRPPLQERGSSFNSTNNNPTSPGLSLSRTVSANSAANSINDAASTQGTIASTSSAALTAPESSKQPVKKKKKKVKTAPEQHTSSSHSARHPASSQAILGSALTNAQLDVRRPTAGPPAPAIVPAAASNSMARPSQRPSATAAPGQTNRRREERPRKPEVSAAAAPPPAPIVTRPVATQRLQTGTSAPTELAQSRVPVPNAPTRSYVAPSPVPNPAEDVPPQQPTEDPTASSTEPAPPAWSAPLTTITLAYTPLHAYLADFEHADPIEEPAAPDSPTTAAFMAALGPGTREPDRPEATQGAAAGTSALPGPPIPNSPPPEFRSRPPTPEAVADETTEAQNQDSATGDDLPNVDPSNIELRERGYASSENEVDLVISQGRGLAAAPDDMPSSDDDGSIYGERKRRWQIRHWEAWRREGVEPEERWKRFVVVKKAVKPSKEEPASSTEAVAAEPDMLSQSQVIPDPTRLQAAEAGIEAPTADPAPVLVPPTLMSNPPVTTETTARVIAEASSDNADPFSTIQPTSQATDAVPAGSSTAEPASAPVTERPSTLASNVRDSLAKFPSIGTVRRARLKRFEAQRQSSKTLGSVIENSPGASSEMGSPASTTAGTPAASPAAALRSPAVTAAALSPSPLPPTRWSGIRSEAFNYSQGASHSPIADSPSSSSLPSLSRLQAMIERRSSKSQERRSPAEKAPARTESPIPEPKRAEPVQELPERSLVPTEAAVSASVILTPPQAVDLPESAITEEPATTEEAVTEEPVSSTKATMTRSKPTHQLAMQLSEEIDKRRESAQIVPPVVPAVHPAETPAPSPLPPPEASATVPVAETRPESPDRVAQEAAPTSPITPKAKKKDARLSNRISRLLRPAASSSTEAGALTSKAASTKPSVHQPELAKPEEPPIPIMTLPRAPPRITTDPLSTDNLRKLSRAKVRSPSFHSSLSRSSSFGDEDDDTSLSSVRNDKSDSDSDSADDESTTRKPDSSLVSYPSGSAPPSTSREAVFANSNAREAAAASWRRSEDGRRYSAILSRPLSIKRKPPPVPAKRWGGIWDKTSVQDNLLQGFGVFDTPEEQNARAGPSGTRTMPGSLPEVAEEESAWETVGQNEPTFSPRLPDFAWETAGRDPPDRPISTSATTRALNFLGMEHPFPPPPLHPYIAAHQPSIQPHPEPRRMPPPPPLPPISEQYRLARSRFEPESSTTARFVSPAPARPASIRSIRSFEQDQPASPGSSSTRTVSPQNSMSLERRPSAPSGSTLQRTSATRRPQSVAYSSPRPERGTPGSLPSSPSVPGQLSDNTRTSLNSRPRHVYSSSVPNASISPTAPLRTRRPLPVPPREDDMYQDTAAEPANPIMAVSGRYSPETSTSRSVPVNTSALEDVTDLEVMLSKMEETGTSASSQVLNEMLGITRGATAEEIDSLPVGCVELERRRIDKNGKLKQKLSCVGINCNKCDICLLQFKEDELAAVLPLCCHVFHAEPCIRSYLRTNNSCPTCQTPLM